MKYNRLLQISFLVALGVSVGCVKKESGFCPAPQEDLQWVYIVESNGLMTASKCIVCDTSVGPGGSSKRSWAIPVQHSMIQSKMR
jgi:hypothetical protein